MQVGSVTYCGVASPVTKASVSLCGLLLHECCSLGGEVVTTSPPQPLVAARGEAVRRGIKFATLWLISSQLSSQLRISHLDELFLSLLEVLFFFSLSPVIS